MTPEERWIKIENAIEALVGSQAQHDAEIAENRKQIAETDKKIDKLAERMERKTAQIDEQIEKNTAAIRDLIVVSRTVVDAQQRLHSEIQAELDQFIKALNAFLKGFQKPNGSQ